MSRRGRGHLAILLGALAVGTEAVVHSGHSTQAVPETIEDVRRILREPVAGVP